MAVLISDESVWAVIALVFLRIEGGSRWADDTVFTVPEWEVEWTLAGFVSIAPDSSGTLLIGWAFTDVISTEVSWKFAWDFAVALLSGVVEYVIGWAWFAS